MPLSLLWLLAASATRASGACQSGEAVASLDFSVPGKGIKVSENVVCGEDAAAAVGRIATHRRTGFAGSKAAQDLLAEFQQALKSKAADYVAAETENPNARPRLLGTTGAHSRRAAESAKKKEYRAAVTDFLRALARPGLDAAAQAKLRGMLDDVLKQAEQSRLQSRSDGDLEELFEALEITDDHASNDDVDMKKLKRQYRELSVKYHPDKNPDSAQYFNYIRDAYEILSDPVKILLYGTGGQEMVQKYEGGSDELERTDNIERKLHVTLEDAYVGTSRSLSVSRRVVCRSCRLYPNLPRCAKCNRCPGKVELQRKWIDNHRFYQEQVEIPSKEKCIQSSEGFDVLVERGVNTGDTISYQGKASQEPSKIPGDLLVQVSVGKHKIFRRVGNDLQVTLKVSLMEALLGFEREIVHLDGHIVTFGIERGVVLKPGAGFEIEGEGMPVREDPTSFGKMLVRFEIDFPDEVPQSAQADLEAALKAVSHGHHGSARVDYRTSQSNKLYKSEL